MPDRCKCSQGGTPRGPAEPVGATGRGPCRHTHSRLAQFGKDHMLVRDSEASDEKGAVALA